MTRLQAALAVCGFVCLATIATLEAQKGKPAQSADVAADAVFRDDPGDGLRSDGVESTLCGSGSAPSRYCGGVHPTYAGLGPECSRIYYQSSSGDYSFRTQSSRCDVVAPALRSVTIDLSDVVSSRCSDSTEGNDTIERTVIERTVFDPETNQNVTEVLSLCGTTSVADVRIEASSMFTKSAAVVSVPFSLHAPPLANTTQFVLEFVAPVPVEPTAGGRTMTSMGQTARLYEMLPGKGGKLVKHYRDEYQLSFSLTATAVP